MPRSNLQQIVDPSRGLDIVKQGWREGFTPEPDLTVSEWADRNRVLGEDSPEPGRWDTSRVPFSREIMDVLSVSHPAQRVVFQKGTQIAGTESGLNWLGYIIQHAPGPALYVLPDLETAKLVSKGRITPMLNETPSLRRFIRPARERDSGNTVLAKEFPGGRLLLKGANAETGLRSFPMRYLFCDEIDGYALDAENMGDPIRLAENRTKNYGRRKKVYLCSTPSIKGHSRIEREYERSDKRRFFVPCPHCDHYQILQFERLRWERGKPHTAQYVCEDCSAPIEEFNKTWMLENGEWRATAVSPVVGFHLSSLYSPFGWYSWAEIAQEWLDAQGDENALRTFYNNTLAESYIERAEAPEWETVYNRREHYPPGVVPPGAYILTAGADLQKDRIEVSIWGWGPNLESWLIEHKVIDGFPNQGEVWRKFKEYVEGKFPTSTGQFLTVAKVAVDTGGLYTVAAYQWLAKQNPDLYLAIKGAREFNAAPLRTSWQQIGRTKRKIQLFTLGVSKMKIEFYSHLNADPADEPDKRPRGWTHFYEVDQEYCKQLVSESLHRSKKGKPDWQQDRARNEALDCRIYARGAAIQAGVDDMTADGWAALAKKFRLKPAVKPGTAGSRPPVPTNKRRVIRSSYVNAG